MKTHLYGYHLLILPNGQQVEMAVVEFDENGHYVSYHQLQRNFDDSFVEEPFVEWRGGTLNLTTLKPHNRKTT